MPRGWLLLLYATLLLWRPVDFAIELTSTLPSMGQRGVPGAIELLIHGLVAALAVAAVKALSDATPAGLFLARAALVASAAASVQSHYWSVLPHQTMPGDRLPLAGLSIGVAVAWLLCLRRFYPRAS